MAGRTIVERYVSALSTNDWDAVAALQHADFVEEYPQSGERIRGKENYRAVMENHPSIVKHGVSTRSIAGSEDRWAMSPSFTLHRIEGSGDTYVFEAEVSYSDQENIHLVAVLKLVDGQIARSTAYFAAPFDAPEWRGQWVEPL